MKFIYKMESVLISITGLLCTILLVKLVFSLRSILPWRVNCWFCNCNFWVKFVERNCWTCPKCEQYNGFTKDGDYNKPLIPASEQMSTPKVFHRSPPRNGLCNMCNINQQLKVAQLANFVPMNDRNYDEEIDSYRLQLEKAYKLCSPCKKVLQMKLHKEKETLLGSKLLEARTPENKTQKHDMQNKRMQSIINSTSRLIAGVIFILILVECYNNIMKQKKLPRVLMNAKEVMVGLLERLYNIIKVKTLITFPSLENYITSVNELINYNILTEQNLWTDKLDHVITLTQKALGGFVCLIQIVGHVLNVNKLKHTIAVDLLWSVFVITTLAHTTVAINPLIISSVKLLSIVAVFFVYGSIKTKSVKPAMKSNTPKRMKNLTSPPAKLIEDEEMTSLETDDDVSLSKFGLRDLTDSSSEMISPRNNASMNGRSFTPRSNDSLWTKPKLNSTFCMNPVLSKSPTSLSDTVFVKPSFNKYQKLSKDDSDSDLDESISSLCIGSPKKPKSSGSIFSLRKFTATPNFVAPTPLNKSRPLISPSKLGHSTSWVAGGYWGSEGDRQMFSIDGSRSSSQSSGFESQASSLNQRNVMSQPSSREESVCGDPDRPSMLDPFQNCNMNSFNYQGPQNFSRVNSPVYPQMQYNSHVQIPQPRFAQQHAPHNVFAQRRQHTQNTFKTPGGSGLIKLPQATPFAR